MDAAWNEDLPLQAEWSTSELLVALREMLLRFLQVAIAPEVSLSSGNREAATTLLAGLVKTRFLPLFGTATGKIDHLKGIDTTEDPHLRVHLREQGEIDGTRLIPATEMEQFSPSLLQSVCQREEARKLFAAVDDLKESFNGAAHSLAKHFQSAPDELMWIHLEDFVEDFSSFEHPSYCLLDQSIEPS